MSKANGSSGTSARSAYNNYLQYFLVQQAKQKAGKVSNSSLVRQAKQRAIKAINSKGLSNKANSSKGSSNKGGTVNSPNTPYMNIYNATKGKIKSNYDTQLAQAASARNDYLANQSQLRNAYRQGQLDVYNANRGRAATENASSINKTNAQYDASAKQNYINYMQAQKNLPSQLNALGIRGGASESSAIRLNTNYGSNVASNEAARNTSIAGLQEAYEKALFDLDQSYAQALRDYDTDYGQRIASYEDTYNTRVADIAADRTNALNNAYMTAKENDLKYKIERRDADLANFEKTIVGRYKKRESYEKLIKKLRAGNDINKKAKIRLAQQAMAQLEEDNGGSGGSGGSSRSYGSGGYSYSSSAYSSNSGNDSGNNGGDNNKSKKKSGNNSAALVNSLKNAIKANKNSKSYTWTASKKKTTGRNRRSISRGNGLIY